MTKSYSQFVCQQCGYTQVGWAGKCPECSSWGSLVETVVSQNKDQGESDFRGTSMNKPVSLSSISSRKNARIQTKIPELDRVLGGGLVEGQVVLIAGEPGIGKSTLLLQTADKLEKTLYVSGEESGGQIAIRANRLGIKKSNRIQFLEEVDIDAILRIFKEKKGQEGVYKAIIIDSIQTITTQDLSGMAGSVGQVREVAMRLVRLAKKRKIPVFIVGHVTKEGSVAGPSVLMHIVDTVLWFEGDKSLTYRLLRAVKNRFGPTDEVGIFSMEEEGLVSQINAEKLFLEGKSVNTPGSAVCSIMQGTRIILVEVQALVSPVKSAFPKRIAQGIDPRRFELLLAVLNRRCNLPLYDFDCYANVAGGIFIKEPSSDLAVCLAVCSSYFDKPLPVKSIFIGEVGLLGDVREVVAQEKRIKEAKRLGYKEIVSSKEIKYLPQAIKAYFK